MAFGSNATKLYLPTQVVLYKLYNLQQR